MRYRPRTLSRLSVAAVLILSATLIEAQPPATPEGTPAPGSRATFPAETAFVEVDAIVTDRAGQPVRDLTRDDFVVLEDGKPQKIDFFTRIDMPYERPEPLAPLPVEPDVTSNERPFEGRLYVIVLDEFHTHPMRSLLVKAAARQFLQRHFADGDLAAVVHTSGGPDAGQELTGSRQRLLAAVDKFMGRKLQSVTQSRIDEYRRTRDIRQPGDPIRDADEMPRAYNARAALSTLESVAQWLGAIRGRRKAVLFFSEGIDYNIHDPFQNRDATTVLDSLKQATAAAVRANVSFYSIDPRGLGGLSSEMMEIQPVFDDPSLGLDPQGLDRDLQRSQDTLRVLADETSGLAAVNTNDFAGAFARLVKDNSAYYLLGYYPVNQKKDGRFHKLEVKVSRPGVRVRARGGYDAPRSKSKEARPLWTNKDTPAPIVELLNDPLPRAGLSMEVQAAAFKGEKGRSKVMVAVQLPGRSFRLLEKDGEFQDKLDLSIIAVSSQGKITGGNTKVDLKLKSRTRELVEAGGFRLISWMDLEPGRYQIRVAGRGTNAEALGSVFYDLEVPELGKKDLALSGLVLTSAVAAQVPGTGSLELLKDVLPAAPTTWRVFHPLDTLFLLTEIYDGEKTPHTLDVATTLTAADGTVAFRSADERKTAPLTPAEEKAGTGVPILHTAQVPLKTLTLAPGAYTLRVEVVSRLGKKPPRAERATVLQILPREPGAAPPSPAPTPPPSGGR
jgi:VWFA-related protein